MLHAEPSRGRHLPHHREVPCAKRDHADRLARPEDAHPEPPRCHVPRGKPVPVFLQDEPRPVRIGAVGPWGQERPLAGTMHALAREVGKLSEFLLAW
jgi:hypothetical protein